MVACLDVLRQRNDAVVVLEGFFDKENSQEVSGSAVCLIKKPGD